MKVKELIARLQKLDPEAEVVKFNSHYNDAYDSCWFVEGTHNFQEDDDISFGRHLVPGRRKFIKGIGKPDFQCAVGGSKAKQLTKFVIIT